MWPANVHMHGAAISDVETTQGGRFIVEHSPLVDELYWAESTVGMPISYTFNCLAMDLG